MQIFFSFLRMLLEVDYLVECVLALYILKMMQQKIHTLKKFQGCVILHFTIRRDQIWQERKPRKNTKYTKKKQFWNWIWCGGWFKAYRICSGGNFELFNLSRDSRKTVCEGTNHMKSNQIQVFSSGNSTNRWPFK